MSFMTIKDIFRHKKSEKGALRPMKSEKDIKRRFIGRVEMKAAQAEKLLDSLKARIEAVYPLIGSVASASICMLLYTIFQLTRLKEGPDRKFRPFPMWKTFSTWGNAFLYLLTA